MTKREAAEDGTDKNRLRKKELCRRDSAVRRMAQDSLTKLVVIVEGYCMHTIKVQNNVPNA